MKLAKIESKLSQVLKSVLPKPLRKNVRYANFIFNDAAGDANYDLTSNSLFFKNQNGDLFKVFEEIANQFDIPRFKEQPSIILGEIGMDNNLRGFAIHIKDEMKREAARVKPFLYDNNNGSTFMLDINSLNVDHTGIGINDTFWRNFDKWYKDNRKQLVTKAPKVKKAKVKKAEPIKVKPLKVAKTEKKNKALKAENTVTH